MEGSVKHALALPLLFSLCLPAVAERRAEDLLERVGDLYRNAESYSFLARERTATQSRGIQKTTRRVVKTARDNEGRLRVELDDGVNSGIVVDDGLNRWVYMPTDEQYMKQPSGGIPLPVVPGIDFAAAAKRFTDRYAIVGESIVEAKIEGIESQPVNGSSVDCLIVNAAYSPPPGMRGGKIERRFWVDRRSLLIVRERSTAIMQTLPAGSSVEKIEEIRFDAAHAGLPVPREVFLFTPPPGARPVESFARTGAGAEGPAPDFALTDFDGKSVRLSSLRGKVVLLDFWATWCGPCRYDMPFVEQLHKELQPRGLEVFGVNGEDVRKAAGYLRRLGYTFPNLRDRPPVVSRLYRVRSIPTFVVIDRQGNLSSYMKGTRSKEQLRLAVMKAGL